MAMNTPVLAGGIKHSVVPSKGFVPNEETAIKIAEAVWIPIYGETINRNKPYKAQLNHGVWVVKGSLPKNMTVGGVPVIEISKEKGTILRVSHGK